MAGTADLNGKLSGLRREYEMLLPGADRLRRELESQISRLVEREGIALGFPIQSRTKSWNSIEDKIDRHVVEITKISDLQDLVGLRLILQFRSQAGVVRNAIANTLAVVREYDTSDRLKDDQFGYASIHIVVKLPGEWLSVPTMAGLGEFMAEIQVRTLSQHIWAAASHELQYKQQNSVPPTIRRAIFRVSALLETVDLELDRILAERRDYIAEAVLDPANDESELNVDLLEKTLDSLWPAANKKRPDDYARLLDELFEVGIRTPTALAQLIESHRATAMKEEAGNLERAVGHLKNGGEPFGSTAARTNAGVYFTHVGLTRIVFEAAYGPDWRKKYLPVRELSARKSIG